LSPFEKNVFINCPFDEKYKELLRPLLFTIIYLGYNPRIANEKINSGESRIENICRMIKESRFSIHDLSRLEAKKKKEIARLNMAFELGVDFGCKEFGKMREKNILVLEENPHRLKKALSDFSAYDFKHHNNDPQMIISEVRDWFYESIEGFPLSHTIWDSFNDFMAHLYKERKERGAKSKDVRKMQPKEFSDEARKFIDFIPSKQLYWKKNTQ